MHKPEDRRRDEKDAEREVWCLSNGDRLPSRGCGNTRAEVFAPPRLPDSNSYLSEFAPRLCCKVGGGIKLALSGYYQTAFHQARDIMETGYLLDYFRTSPKQRAPWKQVDSRTRRKLFDPVKIRIALGERDGDTTMKRQAECNKLSELASHATFRGFQLTTRGEFGELGPFVEKINLMAWLEEMVLRLGPSAVMYANQFPDADSKLIQSFQEFGTELVQGFKR
jgi:hypothetical protein